MKQARKIMFQEEESRRGAQKGNPDWVKREGSD